MTIFVYERDLFVRGDILETLAGGLDDVVREVCSLDQLVNLDMALGDAAVVSLDRSEASAQLAQALVTGPNTKIVLILGSQPQALSAVAGDIVVLPRPFTSEGLLQAVRTVLCVPQPCPQETS